MGGLPAAGGEEVWRRRHLIRCATLTSSGLYGDFYMVLLPFLMLQVCVKSQLSSTDTIGKWGKH